METRITKAAEYLENDPRLVLSHCDLNPANVLWDGTQVWFVDWEVSGSAHPYIDWATHSNFLSLPDTVALDLLAVQEKAPISAHQGMVFAALRDLVRIIYGAMFLQMVPDLKAISSEKPEQILSLSECFVGVRDGTFSMQESTTQGRIGAAFFKQCQST